MNMHAHLFKKWQGKTIEKVEYSDERYEDTWVKLIFTDGTSYTISCFVRIDEYYLDVEEHKT